MQFSELMRRSGLNVSAVGDAVVRNVQVDSRRCGEGSCFIAVRGAKMDGHEYIPAAVAAGASAVVVQDASAVPPGIPYAVADDARSAIGLMAQAVLDYPARKLICAGVTGTNGKTTVTYLLRHILEAAGHRPGLLGTIAYETGAHSLVASNTTPDAALLAEMTEEMVAGGKTHLVMEVSSHALDQHRTAGLDFSVAVFTNLTGDHLDYHGDMEAYLQAKAKLFEGLSSRATACLNCDDAHSRTLAERTSARVCWYGSNMAADVHVKVMHLGPQGSRFEVHADDHWIAMRTRMIGRHNIYNCLAAASAARALGVDWPVIASAIESFHPVAGRLQRVSGAENFSVFVDYAHTDDALRNVLSALRPLTEGKLIVVFGCGGDRDHSKRPRMARTAEELADVIVVTSDNPRSENPDSIIEDILVGFSDAGRKKARVQSDRRSAIEQAIRQANRGDVVLLAGKGHENYQIIGNQRLDFDDVKVAEEILCAGESA
jgi:UDP-N-acetylmuramoyl-L-alanyl-D-glutamate--2,6-diaminopimelate ligase